MIQIIGFAHNDVEWSTQLVVSGWGESILSKGTHGRSKWDD